MAHRCGYPLKRPCLGDVAAFPFSFAGMSFVIPPIAAASIILLAGPGDDEVPADPPPITDPVEV